MAETIRDQKRLEIVMKCYDKLSPELRQWVANLHFSLHDDHILKGINEIERCKEFLDGGGQEHYRPGNGQN